MKRRFLGLGLVVGLTAVVVTACSSGGDGAAAEFGTLTVPLTTVGASGTEYRLRNATFEIRGGYFYYDDSSGSGGASGGESITVSSEDYLDASSIAVDLERGYYYVTLQPGWHLEKLEGGESTPVEATLLSSANQYAYVNAHSTSWVEYQFGLGDRTLWFNGKLNINVQVYEKPSELYGESGASYGGFTGYSGESSYGGYY